MSWGTYPPRLPLFAFLQLPITICNITGRNQPWHLKEWLSILITILKVRLHVVIGICNTKRNAKDKVAAKGCTELSRVVTSYSKATEPRIHRPKWNTFSSNTHQPQGYHLIMRIVIELSQDKTQTIFSGLNQLNYSSYCKWTSK